MYGKDMTDYDDVDIETLLAQLSVDELEELNNDCDPDNSMLPPSERCRDQTSKEPTGKFNRQSLLTYLEDTAKTEEDWEEPVPFVQGKKRGDAFQPHLDVAPDEPEEAAIELDITQPTDNDDDIEDAMQDADESDLVDLAGLLGMHQLLSQPQYYNAIKLKPQDDETGRTFKGIVPAMQPKIVPDEPPNSTDIEACIDKLASDDDSLTEVNINNMKNTSSEKLVRLIDAAGKSKHIEKLAMSNVNMTDKEAQALIPLVENNKSLKTLSIESNAVTYEMIAKILRSACKNQTLIEIHAENQRQQTIGNQIEMEMMQAIEDLDSILRVGIYFQSMEARNRVSEALERNYERLRLKRLEAKG